jgi:uncharacterized membrane protein
MWESSHLLEDRNMLGYTGRLGGRAAWGDERGGHRYGGNRRGQHVFYWPLGAPFLLAGLAAVVLLVTLLQVGLFGALVHMVARPVPGLGIAVPALLPGIFAALVAVTLHPVAVAGLAYAGGPLGTLLGADLVNLPKVRRLGAPVVSIGGAGTFDGVFITGILAVLLAGLL